MPGRHCRPRLEHDRRLDHLDGRRIGRGVGPAELAEHPLDLGKRLQLPVHLLEDPAGLSRRQPGQRRRHVEDRALVHLRHVVFLEAGQQTTSRGDQQSALTPTKRIAMTNRRRQRRSIPRATTPLAIGAGADRAALEHPDDDHRQQEQRQQRRERHRERLAVTRAG